MKRFRIVLLPGDGIGPEVMDATLYVLEAVSSVFDDLHFEFTSHQAGAEHFRQSGDIMPRKVLQDCLDADAVLLAAIGLPDVRQADGTEVQPEMMVGLRRALDLYAAVRPIKLYRGVQSPLRGVEENSIDFVIVRENLEGLFSSFGGGYVLNDEVAGDSLVVTRRGTERVVEYAFHLAQKRHRLRTDGHPLVTCVDKSNVFRSYAFFRKVFFEVAKRHPDVAATAEYIDATSMLMIQQPQSYDVVVTENQFGDILSDLGAGLVGGLGLGPSAEIGEDRALFQPSHGTAPSLAGKDEANPLATILSGAMMLDWLGQHHQDDMATSAAHCIESAVEQLLAEGDVLTPDLGGTSGTKAVGETVASIIRDQRKFSVSGKRRVSEQIS